MLAQHLRNDNIHQAWQGIRLGRKYMARGHCGLSSRRRLSVGKMIMR